MSAPIDDLLFGGDDSGDDDDMNAGMPPMRSYSGVPLTAAPVAPPGGLLTPTTVVTPASEPLAIPIQPQPAVPTLTGAGPRPLVAAPSMKQPPGSGQQMFQQMFALLKQTLPVEQYAALHSEMRKGNGNDIKSIVDIIKRIAGDATFASVIQKMDLTRAFPTNNAPGMNTVKPEPTGVATTVTRTSPTSTPLGMMNRPIAARTTGMMTASPKPTAIAPNTRPIAAAPPTLAATPVAMPAAIAAASAQIQRSTPIQPPVSAGVNVAVSGVKPEPTVTAISSARTTTAATTATASTSSSTPQSRNESLEKIMFAKKLLSHAAGCTQSHGVCQVKKCDDVRRVFKHSTSCGGANGCSHCEQLKGLVKYHAKECPVGIKDHCTIPFCDGMRRSYASAAMTKASQARGFGSDDDDDNTPLSSAVSKAKKHAKAKSPKNSAVNRAGGGHTAVKRKNSNGSLSRTNSSSSPGSFTMMSASIATSTPTGAATAASKAHPQKNVTTNMTQEYGRLLQLILHVEKCTTNSCPVGEECVESKTLMQQMNSPNPPARAKTYKQVYGHYKTCVAKKNTGNCPMCRIGLLPIMPTASPTALLHSPAVKTSPGSATAPGSAASSSPSGGLHKRGNTAVSPTPRSPSKKARTTANNRGKSTAAEAAALSAAASEMVSQELAQASVADIRREADVLTHTNIELSAERRIMMEGGVRRVRMAEQLSCQKEEWVEKDLFNSETLRTQMREASRRSGVELGGQTNEVMSYALHEYLKQVIEEMVEISKQRGDSLAHSLEAMQKARQGVTGRPGGHMELTATDILRVSCEDSFTKLRQEDLVLRSQLLEDAKREEQIERERAKKRKKVDRSKQTQDERDEAEMDIEELAVKDLKERLLQYDKGGVVKVDGRVNESISAKYTLREADNQVTMEDANYWLVSQKPYIRPKLFVRAEAARIVTKALL